MEKDTENYRMFVESAEKISDKRNNQNNYYMSIVGFILTFISTIKIETLNLYIFCAIGIIISILWLTTIDNYAKRNKVKYQIINEYEKENKLKWFSEEDKRTSVLTNLTTIEKIIPIVFIIIFIIVMISK